MNVSSYLPGIQQFSVKPAYVLTRFATNKTVILTHFHDGACTKRVAFSADRVAELGVCNNDEGRLYTYPYAVIDGKSTLDVGAPAPELSNSKGSAATMTRSNVLAALLAVVVAAAAAA
eukprot:comp23301_c3_seq1/m.38260 comp23301_c3_seq1/g.38260  ORF comp23301_c3_seq1/g.38260 comp23301_c3_seq1/m.38260 type:complete len:118 (-) comp23301_c3_seq1:464-817(-)